jgi:hypothetical protein
VVPQQAYPFFKAIALLREAAEDRYGMKAEEIFETIEKLKRICSWKDRHHSRKKPTTERRKQ